MDAVIILGIAIALCFMNNKEDSLSVEQELVVLETKLNPEFYHDERAFMVIANELGFN